MKMRMLGMVLPSEAGTEYHDERVFALCCPIRLVLFCLIRFVSNLRISLHLSLSLSVSIPLSYCTIGFCGTTRGCLVVFLRS